jgi:HlyD family secretion protein
MNKTWKWILIITGILLVIIVGGKILFPKDTRQKVAVENVVRRTIVETVTASGQIYPEVEVKISPDISGEVTDLTVQEGDSVKKGQVLARIYADITALQRDEAASRVSQSQATVANSQAALQALDASVTQARQAYDRNKKLYNDKVISQSELEQYETTLRTATANYEAAKENIRSLQAGVRVSQTGLTSANKNLERATIVAPMNGVISSLSIKKGERVVGTAQMAGTEMMTVADMSVLEVRVDVGENDIVKVSIGDSADVSVDAYNRRKFRGVVTQIASSTKSSSSAVTTTTTDVTNYEVRIRLDKSSYQDLIDPANPKKFPFRPGMNANADIKTKRVTNVLAVPIAAVSVRTKGTDQSMSDRKKEKEENKADDNGASPSPETTDDDMEEVVFVVQENGAVKKQVVRSGIQDATYIEVLSGLKTGEQIVTAPYTTISEILKDGMKVKVVPKEELFRK